MNGIWRAVPVTVSLRRAGKRSTSAGVSFVLSMVSLKHGFQPWNERQNHTFRAHSYFGSAMHPIVVGMPAAIGVKRAGGHMRLHNDRCALQGHSVCHILAQETP